MVDRGPVDGDVGPGPDPSTSRGSPGVHSPGVQSCPPSPGSGEQYVQYTLNRMKGKTNYRRGDLSRLRVSLPSLRPSRYPLSPPSNPLLATSARDYSLCSYGDPGAGPQVSLFSRPPFPEQESRCTTIKLVKIEWNLYDYGRPAVVHVPRPPTTWGVHRLLSRTPPEPVSLGVSCKTRFRPVV